VDMALHSVARTMSALKLCSVVVDTIQAPCWLPTFSLEKLNRCYQGLAVVLRRRTMSALELCLAIVVSIQAPCWLPIFSMEQPNCYYYLGFDGAVLRRGVVFRA